MNSNALQDQLFSRFMQVSGYVDEKKVDETTYKLQRVGIVWQIECFKDGMFSHIVEASTNRGHIDLVWESIK